MLFVVVAASEPEFGDGVAVESFFFEPLLALPF